MKRVLFACLLLAAFPSVASEVYRCEEPKGSTLHSVKGHKAEADGFTGVEPVVIIEGKEMRVVWGDSKTGPSQENVWKAAVVNDTPDSISGIALDKGPGGSAMMLFTLDRKRRFLYMSTHKDVALYNASSAASFVSKCTR